MVPAGTIHYLLYSFTIWTKVTWRFSCCGSFSFGDIFAATTKQSKVLFQVEFDSRACLRSKMVSFGTKNGLALSRVIF
jgi:hypothetical protein